MKEWQVPLVELIDAALQISSATTRGLPIRFANFRAQLLDHFGYLQMAGLIANTEQSQFLTEKR